MKKIIYLLAFLPLFFSCSSDTLTNTEAAEIIKTEYPTFCFTTKLINRYSSYQGRFDKKSKHIKGIADRLKNQGLISINIEQITPASINYTMVLTQKAKDLGYGDKKFGFAQRDFVEIIGISQTENEAIVRYKMKRTKTPFYDLHEAYYYTWNNYTLECPPKEFEKDITLIKFDDGWKVK